MNDDIKLVLYDELCKNSRVLVELAEKLSKYERLDISLLDEMNYFLSSIYREITNIREEMGDTLNFDVFNLDALKITNMSLEDFAYIFVMYAGASLIVLLNFLGAIAEGHLLEKHYLDILLLSSLFNILLSQEYLILSNNKLSGIEKNKYFNEINEKKQYLDEIDINSEYLRKLGLKEDIMLSFPTIDGRKLERILIN